MNPANRNGLAMRWCLLSQVVQGPFIHRPSETLLYTKGEPLDVKVRLRDSQGDRTWNSHCPPDIHLVFRT
jgi:hypothetical protein